MSKYFLEFCTVTRRKANNKSANVKLIAVCHFLLELILINIKIALLTTDNVSNINKLFATKFPEIQII